MDKNKIDIIRGLVIDIINTFPHSKNNEPFLKLQNGRKLFFGIFLKKYGIHGNDCIYTDQDVIRRVRLVEFFDYFVKDYLILFKALNNRGQSKYEIKSTFHKMIIVDAGTLGRSRLELLSIYQI